LGCAIAVCALSALSRKTWQIKEDLPASRGSDASADQLWSKRFDEPERIFQTRPQKNVLLLNFSFDIRPSFDDDEPHFVMLTNRTETSLNQ
jgi:hypothetical protein